MTKTNEELSKDIRNLRNEISQMREIVNMLFNMVVEYEAEDAEDPFLGIGELIQSDVPRFNT